MVIECNLKFFSILKFVCNSNQHLLVLLLNCLMPKKLFYLFCSIILFCSNTSNSNNDSFSIIIIPDTQYYSLRDNTNNFPDTYKMQTQWIANNVANENIQFVIHMGDMTHNNTQPEWLVADEAHQVLDQANIPYSVMPGNHDYPENEHIYTDSLAMYNQYFGAARFANKSWYGGSYDNYNGNNYSFFSYDNFDFLVLSFEFAPSKDVLCWADNLISAHPNHNVIISTHCYLTSDTNYSQTCNSAYDVTGSSGDDIWNELVRRHSNISFVLSGHIGNDGYRIRTGNAGNCIHEILTDYQLEEHPDVADIFYGNGWLRKMTFTPAIGTVDVESFSVLPNINTLNWGNYNSDPEHLDHRFTIQDTYLTPTYTRTQLSNTFNDMAVNVNYTGDQLKAEVATAANGDFVVVWEDDTDDNGYYQIFARGFYIDGCEKFPPFTVNQAHAGQQLNPHIDMNAAGDFVVVWEDDSDVDSRYQILAASFDQFGNRNFNDITVNYNINGVHFGPRVGVQDDGNFMVVWQDDSDDNGYYQIVAAGFNTNAVKMVSDFTVNQVGAGQQLQPDIAISPAGKYIIVWDDDSNGNNIFEVIGAGFAANSNTRLFNDISINGNFSGNQQNAKVSIDANENFTVVWEDDNNGNSIYQILGAHFNIAGQKIGSDFIVKPDQVGQLKNPDISKRENGDYIICWEDDSDGNTFTEIKAKGYTASNSVLFNERTINEDASGNQLKPVVSFSYSNNYTVVWEDDINQDDSWQILANAHDLMETNPPADNCNPACRQELHFSASQNIDSLYEASDNINSSSQINSDIIYSAGDCVNLKSGLEVGTNTNFTAKIEGCD